MSKENTNNIVSPITSIVIATACCAYVLNVRPILSQKKQQKAEQAAKQAAIDDSLRNTIEYKQALEMYNQLSDEQKQLIQQETVKTK